LTTSLAKKTSSGSSNFASCIFPMMKPRPYCSQGSERYRNATNRELNKEDALAASGACADYSMPVFWPESAEALLLLCTPPSASGPMKGLTNQAHSPICQP
jgi:hypothetical protein